ncbi:FtsX-like permease family protein [Luteococcus sp. Sow4_B9]|uniref:FtsX-like permease family protein n=1 Tax=Luteococcus sp. Sow4_B9 TaxID=3438792 RepID=UPI003F9C57F8
MRHLHLAELRDSWTAWLSVSLTFITVNAAFALLALASASAQRAAAGGLHPDLVMTNDFTIGINQGMCALVGLIVIGTVTGLVVGSRRGSIARLQLAGASPRHVVATLMTQLAVVSLTCAVIGDLIAILSVQGALDAHTTSQQMERIPAVFDPLAVLGANLLCTGIAMLGGLRASLRATRIPPVEALRQASTAPSARKGMVGRILWSILMIALIAGLFALTPQARKVEDQQFAMQAVMQAALMLIPLVATLLTQAAPLTTGLLTRGWTRLVPGRSGTWHLARNTVLGKMDRLQRTVIPVMITMGLLFSMMTLGNSFAATLKAMGNDVQLTDVDLPGLLVVMGLPLAIAVAGALSALLMMARQREAELALDEILGATPAQRVLVPLLEATIITVTAFLQAAFLTLVVAAYMRLALPIVLSTFQVVIPWGTILVISLVILVATALCTVVPTLPSLKMPPPRVISRRVAA